MSKEGPRLLSSKAGYAFAKFYGSKISCGRADDSQSRIRFAALKAKWEAGGRELSADMLEARRLHDEGAVTVAQVCDQYLAHVY